MNAKAAKVYADRILNDDTLEIEDGLSYARQLARWTLDALEVLQKIETPMPGSRDNELVLYYERLAKEFLESGATGLVSEGWSVGDVSE